MSGIAQSTNEKRSLREEYGATLVELGETDKDIVVLDSDLSGSTKTAMFAKKFPDRFFNMGVAEADMVSTAAGLAAAGKKPFASTFAVFATGRAWDQIRQSVCLSELNVTIAATHGGVTVGEDGPSHQALEDIALMRVMPGMTVVVPCDAAETRAAVKVAAGFNGPLYLRLTRDKFPVIYGNESSFTIGKGDLLREGNDVAIIACGLMVSEALKAAELLEKDGVSAAVVNMASIRPIDEALIADLADKCGAMVTVEEHSIIGGLGSAVTEVVAESSPVPVIRVGMPSAFGKSGPAKVLLEYFGLNAAAIVESTHKSIALKR